MKILRQDTKGDVMPKVRIMFSGNVKNPMCYGSDEEKETELHEFDYLPKIGESVYLRDDDIFYNVVNVIHEPKRPNSIIQKWSTVIVLSDNSQQ